MHDFDEQIERRNTNSLKWCGGDDELPLWVADMDFQAPPEVLSALREYVDHGVFGYPRIPRGWRDSIISWWKRRYNITFKPEWLLFSQSVVPAISSIIRSMTRPGDSIILQTPVYNCFFSSIEDNGRFVLENPLIYTEGEYEMDFEDLEQKLSLPKTSMMILCNPHNPIGKLWDAQTLKRVGDLCAEHHALLLSDEIHGDITDPGVRYIPFLSCGCAGSDNSITCIAPSKTFNLAGLQTSAVVVPDEQMRYQVERGLGNDKVNEPNTFACIAAQVAYDQGEVWLTELIDYLYGNKKRVQDYIQREIPEIRVVASEATYLLWLDCRELCSSGYALRDFIRSQTGLMLCAGEDYGKTAGAGFLRMNIACPQATLDDALDRLKRAVVALQHQ